MKKLKHLLLSVRMSIYQILFPICIFISQIKSNRRKFRDAEDALVLLIAGIIVVGLLFVLAIFIIMNIEKIAIAILIMSVGLLAIVAALQLAKKGFSWISKKA